LCCHYIDLDAAASERERAANSGAAMPESAARMYSTPRRHAAPFLCFPTFIIIIFSRDIQTHVTFNFKLILNKRESIVNNNLSLLINNNPK
jgi:hypothetical protein